MSAALQHINFTAKAGISAAARAGASLTPSPTIPTTPEREGPPEAYSEGLNPVPWKFDLLGYPPCDGVVARQHHQSLAGLPGAARLQPLSSTVHRPDTINTLSLFLPGQGCLTSTVANSDSTSVEGNGMTGE